MKVRIFNKERPFDSRSFLNHSLANNLSTVFMQQVHGNTITILNNHHQPNVQTALNTDAVISTHRKHHQNLYLIISHADCLPIFIYHKSGILAAIHAGRKGTKQRILAKTLLEIRRKFRIVSNLEIWFGPHICAQCYQISKKPSLYYNLRVKNLDQLLEVYEPTKFNLVENNICTLESGEFYSYRESGKGVEMNYSVAWISS